MLAVLSVSGVAAAQVGPLESRGFLEYRYRNFDSEVMSSNTTHNVALQGGVSTYLWRPWIANLDVLATFYQLSTDTTNNDGESTAVTGRIRTGLFSQSRFPFAAFYETRDSRLDSDEAAVDNKSRTFGFLQRYTSDRLGNYSIEYRNVNVDDLFTDGSRVPRLYENGSWYVRGQRAFGRNEFILNSQLTEIDRQGPDQTNDLLRHTLRHRFRGGPTFRLENTVFSSTEDLGFNRMSMQTRFTQLSSITSWRPVSDSRLLFTGRGLLQNIETVGNGNDRDTMTTSLAGTATYRFTPRLLLTGSVGGGSMDEDGGGSMTRLYQQVRLGYQSDPISLRGNVYRWGAFTGLGNRTGDETLGEDDQVQELDTSLFHSLSRPFFLAGGGQFEIRGAQRVQTVHDTFGRERNTLQHTVDGTYSKRSGNVNRYLRMSVTDRRSFGDDRNDFQLVNLQLSVNKRPDRYRTLSGNLTLQYTGSAQEDVFGTSISNGRLSYSANLVYQHANLFTVNSLNLTSEMRFRSLEYRTTDPVDPGFDVNEERISSLWRNRLDYRIGAIVLRLDGEIREVDGNWSTLVSLYARRYFGGIY